ncbi:hypothetical protein M9H77_06907 [Catharanthus roseus]|uniref:Uncharacterized protein n=1 Tax=Catharanthus roseus TaxID=4058 RepID=A0ACC0BTQ5_CATRO|nr:hypothetical protein M9H77_06907 [Catharanthus roseus]
MLMLEGVKTLKKEEVVGMEGQEKEKEWQLEVGGRDISFDDRLLNTILETSNDGIRFYTKKFSFFITNRITVRVFNTFCLILLELVIPLGLEKSTTNILLKEWVLQKMRKGQEGMNIDEEESEEEQEEETYRKEMRQKKRQERVEEGQSSGSMTQIMDMVTSLKYKMHMFLLLLIYDDALLMLYMLIQDAYVVFSCI